MTNIESILHDIIINSYAENIAVRIGKNDSIISEHYLSKSKEINCDTLFDMASITKIIVTTTLALIALDKKLIFLDDSVGKFFRCPENKLKMTIKNLFTHTMGIGHKKLNIQGNTQENIAEYILNIPSDIPIGSDVLYSCPGFILLGKILEKTFGESLDELFQKYIAKPLDMKASGYKPSKGIFVNSNLGENETGIVNDYNCRFLGGVAGNAGLFSNISDVTKYVLMLLRNGEPLISKETFYSSIKNYTENMNESRGLGFLYVDERYNQTGKLFHTGSIGHCGHTGQSVFVDVNSGFYVIILSDMTISTVRKYGKERYSEVILLREKIHNAIKKDLF